MDSRRTWTVIALINWCTEYLQVRRFKSPKTNTELLLAYTLGVDRLDLYLNYGRVLTAGELERFRGFFKRRLKKEPIQYITGESEFMSLPFLVTPRVLIPRTETEILVEKALKYGKELSAEGSKIQCLDIGAGSGNIAVAIAYYLPYAQVIATDSSKRALRVTKKNIYKNNVHHQVTPVLLDIFDKEAKNHFANKFHMIVANPPYISEEEFDSLPPEIKEYEPHTALRGGEDGLDFYRRIAQLVRHLLLSDGRVVFEVGAEQGPAVTAILEDAKFSHVEILQDLTGRDRVVCGIFNQTN